MNKCPICGFQLIKHRSIIQDFHNFECVLCGKYYLQERILFDLKNNCITLKSPEATGWILENQETNITWQVIDLIKSLPRLNVAEKATKVLQRFAFLFPYPGQVVSSGFQIIDYGIRNNGNFFNSPYQNSEKELQDLMSLYVISRASNIEEFRYLLFEYLSEEKRYIWDNKNLIKITPAGWVFLDSLQQRNEQSKIAFIAMRFTDELKEFCDNYVDKGIKEAGYEPLRIDKHEHNNLIDDEIIAGIRRSKFLIADFTENSYGAYYEAGYARGFNIPVIYLCNKEFFENGSTKIHFDVNHYSMILWDYDKGDELVFRLKNRIEATVGRGPNLNQ